MNPKVIIQMVPPEATQGDKPLCGPFFSNGCCANPREDCKYRCKYAKFSIEGL